MEIENIENVAPEVAARVKELLQGTQPTGGPGRKPLAHENFGEISVSIWPDVYVDRANQETKEDCNVSLERRYKDKQGAWQGSTTYYRRNLADLYLAVTWAMMQVHECRKRMK